MHFMGAGWTIGTAFYTMDYSSTGKRNSEKLLTLVYCTAAQEELMEYESCS
jgi:hypothetical protein